jgi:hypothetical protein
MAMRVNGKRKAVTMRLPIFSYPNDRIMVRAQYGPLAKFDHIVSV